MVSLVASPNGLITSRRQTISVSVSPTPYESFIGHLPGVTFSANCSLSILCQLYYRCLFKTVCARNNSPNKGTASDEKDMFSHHKGLIYLNLSSWDKWYIQTVGQLRFENWHWVLIREKKKMNVHIRWQYLQSNFQIQHRNTKSVWENGQQHWRESYQTWRLYLIWGAQKDELYHFTNELIIIFLSWGDLHRIIHNCLEEYSAYEDLNVSLINLWVCGRDEWSHTPKELRTL